LDVLLSVRVSSSINKKLDFTPAETVDIIHATLL